MSYLLLTGLIMLFVPLVLLLSFAMVILIGFVRDDNDALTIFRVAVGVMVTGIFLILLHFGMSLAESAI